MKVTEAARQYVLLETDPTVLNAMALASRAKLAKRTEEVNILKAKLMKVENDKEHHKEILSLTVARREQLATNSVADDKAAIIASGLSNNPTVNLDDSMTDTQSIDTLSSQ